MATLVEGNEITLSGTVGDMGGWFWDDGDQGFDAMSVINALAQVGRTEDVTIYLNSGGGIATEGAAIHAVLSAHKGKVVVVVQGIAASSASLLAMAGDEILMSPGSIMMIHDPAGMTVGTVADHEIQMRALNALADSYAGIYADKSGKSQAKARQDMKDEIWLTPADAVKQGYATGTVAKKNAPNEPEPSAFNYSAYKHPPAQIVALMTSQAWDKRKRPTAQGAPPKQEPRIMDFTPEQRAAIDAEKAEAVKKAAADATAAAEAKAKADAEAAEAAAATAASASTSRADAAAISTACATAGFPDMAAQFITAGTKVADVQARMTSAAEIRDIVAKARKTRGATISETFAAECIAAGKSVKDVRADLFDHFVAEEEKVPTNPALLPNAGQDANAKASAEASRKSMEAVAAARGVTLTK